MIGLFCFALAVLGSPFKSKLRLEAELRVLMDEPRKSAMGAPRIHGELLKLGFEVAQSSVAKYMVKRRGPPSQGWRAFLCNHAQMLPPWTCSWFRPLARPAVVRS